jgi:hypothetical protein
MFIFHDHRLSDYVLRVHRLLDLLRLRPKLDEKNVSTWAGGKVRHPRPRPSDTGRSRTNRARV